MKTTKQTLIILIVFLIVFLAGVGIFINSEKINSGRVFIESFDGEFILEETAIPEQSQSADWWLNSGAFAYWKNGRGATIQGDLTSASPWYQEYLLENPSETDQGKHPQNVFRLITRRTWKNFEQSAYFKIRKLNLSDSPDRRESNGLLFLNRYQDEDNLYYTGIRVDGYAVIKKKQNGIYYTIRDKKVIADSIYDQELNPNLLPFDEWIGLKTITTDTTDKRVRIQVFIDIGKTGNWELVLDQYDDEAVFGRSIILHPGYAGIRTDFMDVEFDDYKLVELEIK